VVSPQFFLMEKAGRRKLLLTGFLSIAVCNLLMTVVDATLVGDHPSIHLFCTCCSKCNPIDHVPLISRRWHQTSATCR